MTSQIVSQDARRCSDRRGLLVRRCVASCCRAAPAAARRRSASSTSTTGRTISTRRCSRISPRRPASRCATTPSIPTTRWRPSCWPASPATTSWCRPPISSSARSRPACSRSSTRRSCRTWPISGRRSRSGSRPTIPATSTPSTTCGARPASATTSRRRARCSGARRQDRQLGHRVQAGESRQVQGLRRAHARFLRRHHAGGAALSRARSELDQAGRSARRPPI